MRQPSSSAPGGNIPASPANLREEQALNPLRKHGAVGLILACYTLGLVLLQLVLIRVGGSTVLLDHC